jgi:hypothetical protein
MRRTLLCLSLFLIACGDDDSVADDQSDASSSVDASMTKDAATTKDAASTEDASNVDDASKSGDAAKDAASDPADASDSATVDADMAGGGGGRGGCDSRQCWCDRYCTHVTLAACGSDFSMAECSKNCMVPDKDECAKQDLALLMCRALLRQEEFSCAPTAMAMPIGCDHETVAFIECFH